MGKSRKRRPRCQAGSLQQRLAQQPGLPLAQHLPAEQVNDLCQRLGHFFRERLFTPAVTLWTFLSQVLDPDHSCRQAVARLLAFRTAQGLSPCSPDTGAYCKARARLPEELLSELTRGTGQQTLADARRPWLWKGRRVKVVDGSGLSMPDTPENQRAYPKSAKLPPGVGFPVLRVVVLFSLAVGSVLDAALGCFQGKGTGEVSLFRELEGNLERGDVLLADRLYANFWIVARCLAAGVDVVMRQHAGRKPLWYRGRGHRTDNRRVWWQKPPRPEWLSQEDYDRLPQWVRLRGVRVDVRQRGFRTRRLTVVTSFLDAEAVRGSELADLYRWRWQAELNLRALKISLQMDVLRGQTPEMVRKEVWAHLLVYNLVREIMAQAALTTTLDPAELSFKGALQTVNAFLEQMRLVQTAEEARALWEVLLRAVGTHRVGNRPDRYEPRARKRRPKNYPRLKEPRAEARRRLRERPRRSGKKR